MSLSSLDHVAASSVHSKICFSWNPMSRISHLTPLSRALDKFIANMNVINLGTTSSLMCADYTVTRPSESQAMTCDNKTASASTASACVIHRCHYCCGKRTTMKLGKNGALAIVEFMCLKKKILKKRRRNMRTRNPTNVSYVSPP